MTMNKTNETVEGEADRVREESGQALAEYSLILAFIAMACIIALGILGLNLAGHLSALANAFP